MRRLRRAAVLLLTAASVAWCPAPAAAMDEEVRTISTRPGVTQPFLLVRPDAPPTASVVLFTGGDGVLRDGNFLVRNRRTFAAQGLLVAVVDVPSDRKAGYGWFRTSKEHATDAAGVIAALRQEAPVPVWLVGTSMGTVSAANVAARLTERGADGLVLTSTVTDKNRWVPVSVRDTDLDEIRVPVLIVHHESDGCAVTPLGAARQLPRQLKRAPRKEILVFEGGDPVGDPCEAFSSHGFRGIDEQVVKAIADWIKTPPRP